MVTQELSLLLSVAFFSQGFHPLHAGGAQGKNKRRKILNLGLERIHLNSSQWELFTCPYRVAREAGEYSPWLDSCLCRLWKQASFLTWASPISRMQPPGEKCRCNQQPTLVLQFVKGISCMLSCLVICNSLRPHGLQPTQLLCPWNFTGKNIGVGYHFLQGIFPSQGSNPHVLCLMNWQADSSPLSHLEGTNSICYNLPFVPLRANCFSLPCFLLPFHLVAGPPAFWLVQFLVLIRGEFLEQITTLMLQAVLRLKVVVVLIYLFAQLCYALGNCSSLVSDALFPSSDGCCWCTQSYDLVSLTKLSLWQAALVSQ